MLLKVLVIVAVLALPVPALGLGCRGLFRRTGYDPGVPGDRASYLLLVVLRLLTVLLLFVLSAVCIVSAVGALLRDLRLPNLVYVFTALDLLLGVLVLLTFGRRERRPVRRRATPARR